MRKSKIFKILKELKKLNVAAKNIQKDLYRSQLNYFIIFLHLNYTKHDKLNYSLILTVSLN